MYARNALLKIVRVDLGGILITTSRKAFDFF